MSELLLNCCLFVVAHTIVDRFPASPCASLHSKNVTIYYYSFFSLYQSRAVCVCVCARVCVCVCACKCELLEK